MSSLQTIQTILSIQAQVGRPSQNVCLAVAGLKDLCDLTGTGPVEWRKGGGPAVAHPIRASGGRPIFRNNGGSSSPSSPSSPANKNLSPRSPAPHTPAPGSPFTPSQVGGQYIPSRYQSKFKNSAQPVEDKILNNIILSKLNKFSGSTYDDVRDFLYQILGSGEPDLIEMVRHFMIMVFKKAASEEVYCALYARLLADISVRYSVILEEMQKLQANYLDIFDEVEEVPQEGDNYTVFLQKNKEKRYRQGYSQFLAELTALEILDLSNLEQTFRKLTDLMLKYACEMDKKSLVEEYADCLVRMTRVLKKRSSPFFVSARSSMLNISKTSVDTLLDKKEAFPSLSPKARFILMDIKDNLTA